MRSYEFLTELGNKVYPYTQTNNNEFTANLPDDRILRVMFYSVNIEWGSAIEISFSIDNSFEVTKKGDQFRIFSTVLKIIQNHLHAQIDPDDQYVLFSAEKSAIGRVILYSNRAVPLISEILGPDWEFETPKRDGDEIIFIWKRRTAQDLNESISFDQSKKIISKFLKFAQDQLDLDKLPKIHLLTDSEHSVEQSSFGGYSNGHVYLTIKNRHINDCLRSLAHELVHYKQDLAGELHPGSGQDGSPEENEANAQAAVVLRKWGKLHPGLFGASAIG